MKFDKTPRFQTKRPDTPHTNREPHVSHELTKPLTPKLITKARSRPVHVESAAEKEEKETKEVERYVMALSLTISTLFDVWCISGLRNALVLLLYLLS